LPYMADKTHIPDTLFLVSEEDWRIFKADEQVTSEHVGPNMYAEAFPDAVAEMAAGRPGHVYPETVYEARKREIGAQAASASAGAASSSSAGVPPAPVGSQTGKYKFHMPRPEKPKGFVGYSPHLQDVMKMCCQAHRAQLGGLVWLSWDGKNQAGGRIKPGKFFLEGPRHRVLVFDQLRPVNSW